MTSSREYFSPESAPEKGTNLALNREFFSRGAVEEDETFRGMRPSGSARGLIGADRFSTRGEEGFVAT